MRDSEIFRKIVEHRRSVRKYTDEAVPESVMRDAFDLALLAPNSSNLQCWEFHWIRTPELKAAMTDICLGQNGAKTAAEIVVAVGRTKTWKANSRRMVEWLNAQEAKGAVVPPIVRLYYEKVVYFSYGQGPFGVFGPIKRVLAWIGSWVRPVPQEPNGRTGMKIWATKSTALACENFMLAIAAHGYDTLPMEGFDSRRLRRLLKLPRDAVIPMVISVGRRAPNGIYGERIRFDSKHYVIER